MERSDVCVDEMRVVLWSWSTAVEAGEGFRYSRVGEGVDLREAGRASHASEESGYCRSK